MSTAARILMAYCLCVSFLPSHNVLAQDGFPEVRQGIMEFANRIDAAGTFGEFGIPIPMTNSSPGEIMGLNGLFTGAFSHITNALTVTPPAPFVVGEVTVEILTIAHTPDGEKTNLVLTLRATRTVDLPISYANDPEEIPNPAESGTCSNFIDDEPKDGLIDGEDPDCTPIIIENSEAIQNVTFQLDATFNLQYDPAVADPLKNFYLTGEPTLSLTYTSDGSIKSFPSRIGIADVNVTGEASHDVRIDAKMIDEDGNGKIALWDMDNTILEDLIRINYFPEMDVNLDLTSALADEAGALTLHITDAGDSSTPTLTIPPGGNLWSFMTIGPDELLTGLASYAYALDTVWVVNEGDLPFIAERYHDLFKPGSSLITLVRRQGDALVLCGTEQASPPGGTPDPAKTQTIYCQAVTAEEPSQVVAWRLSGGPTPTYLGALEDTTGTSPTAWAVFQDVTGDAWKDIEVEFQYTVDGEAETFFAEPRIRTVSDLEKKLEEFSGVTVGALQFNPVTHALVYPIIQTIDPPAGSIHLAFGDLLMKDAGLSNVLDDATVPGKNIDLGLVTVQAGFGVVLEADLEDRYFLSTASGNEMVVSGLEVSIPDATILPASIGALGVDVEISSFALTGEVPLAIDIKPYNSDVISTRVLIDDPVRYVSAAPNLGINATLDITSKGLASPVTGTVTIGPSAANIQLDAGAEQLKAFNINPDNPQALVTLLLDGIYNRTAQMNNEESAAAPLPLVGLNTRDLAPQFSAVIHAVNAVKNGSALAEVNCEVLEAPGDGENTQIQVSCWAVSDLDPVSVSWAINPAAISTTGENLSQTTTVWKPQKSAGDKAVFVISETATAAMVNQMSVTLTLNGEEIQFPYAPPKTLADLDLALEQQLGLGTGGVQFMLNTSGGDPALQVVISKADIQQEDFLLQLTLLNAAGAGYRLAAQEGSELIASVSSEFNLDFNLPLTPAVTMNDLSFNPGSLVSLDVKLNGSDLDLDASLGGMLLRVGEQAVLDAGHRPELELGITAVPADYGGPGETIQVSYTITNAGDFTLSGPFQVVAGSQSVSCGDASTRLFPADDPATTAVENVRTCSAAYVTTSEDAAASAVIHRAHAEGMFGEVKLVSPTVEVKLLNTNRAEIGLSVSASPEIFSAAGDVLTYTYIIENTGNVPLAGPFSVTSSNAGDIAPCGTGPLEPGGKTTCSNTYTVTAADATSVVNQATASVTHNGNLVSAKATMTVTTTASPALGLTVNVNAGTIMLGENLLYTYEVENTGNVTLTGTSITDSLVTVACPAEPLPPAAFMTCTASYTVTQADLETGSVISHAQASVTYNSTSYPSLQVDTSLAVTDVTGQSGVSFSYRSTLQYDGTAWDRLLTGLVDGDDNDVEITLAVSSVQDAEEKFIGLLDYHAEIAGETSVVIPSEMEEALGMAPLEISLLPLSLPLVGALLQDSLDGDRWGISVPLAGSDLAAGEDFAVLLTTWAEALDTGMESLDTANPASVHDTLQTAVKNAFGIKGDGNLVDVYCGTALCNTESDASQAITRIEVQVTVPKEGSAQEIPFNTGLPGLALEVTGDKAVDSANEWTMNLTFGLDQFAGPYLEINNETDNLVLNANLSIAKAGTACAVPVVASEITATFTASDERCMQGMIGLLPGTLYDGVGDKKSRVVMNTIFNFSGGSGGRLAYADLLDGLGASQPPQVEATDGGSGPAQVNLMFVTNTSTIPMPKIAGTIHLVYEQGVYTVDYKNIYMNPTTFFEGFLGPLVKDVQKYTRPLQPVVDTVTAPIPVISDLAEMVGSGSVSLLTILERISGNDLSMITKLAGLITFINKLPADSNDPNSWMALGPTPAGEEEAEAGEFSVEVEQVKEPPCGKEDNNSSWCDSPAENKERPTKPETEKKDDKKGELEAEGEVEWSGAGISIPIIEDTGQIYSMLLGVDATLVRVDLGTLKASAGLQYTYGPFMIGPVPVSVTIGGTVTFTGRFAIGYDTRGLRQALRGNAFTGDELLQGIYIDDLDGDGKDVPEIELEVEIYAGAAVSIRIFEAGIRAGVKFNVELNWNDPNDDGKLRFEEIRLWQWRPVCLFDKKGSITFYLKFYLKIDLFLFTAEISWTPLSKKFELFDESCDPPSPVLGQKDGNRFRLNMGENYATDRNIAIKEINEKFIVRQLTPEGHGCANGPADTCTGAAGTWISVTFMGIYQEFLVPLETYIYAEAGKGNDTISLLPGTDKRESTRGVQVPFTLNAELYGGEGNDQFDTGTGNDFLNGGAGNDTLNARSGDDILLGGSGDAADANNSLEGGLGFDILVGGPGVDILNGGPGRDLLIAAGGDDNLSGGPGMPPTFGTDDAIRDKTDVLVGGEGADILDGSFDADHLFGDEMPGLFSTSSLSMETKRENTVQAAIDAAAALNCLSVIGGSGDDNMLGGDGDDFIHGGGGNDRLEGEKGDDTLCGNNGHDVLTGGTGADQLYGNADHDWLQGDQGDDQLFGGTGEDDLLGGEGKDTLEGEEHNDILIGDDGSLEDHPQTCDEEGNHCIPTSHPTDTSRAPDFVLLMSEPSTSTNVSYDDVMHGGAGNDFMFGEFGADRMDGDGNDDYMEGNAGDDIMNGGAGVDHMFGGQGNDTLHGDSEDDRMWGNSGDDVMYGGDGSDTLYGNTGDDHIEGNSGTDTLYGGADQDDMIGGGAVAGSPDAADWLYGDEGDDRIAGDNALISRSPSSVTLLDVELSPGAIDPARYGGDWIEGNNGNDKMWGQGGEDNIFGGAGDDYLEGNHASDALAGDAGDDDILGGSSPVYSGLTSVNFTDRSTSNRTVPLGSADQVAVPLGDTIHGGEGSDIILGDNGIIGRPYGNSRLSYQLEIATVGDTFPQHATGGNGARVMRSISMSNTSAGSTAGSDLIFGDAGEDELYGQFDDTDQASPAMGDELDGGDGQDLLIGDQGVAVARVLTGETLTIRSNPPFLKDVISLNGTLFWEVDLSQGAADGNDRLLGGNGADFLHGNGGEDLLNGNAGNDRLFGDDGEDALWGGLDHDHLWGGAGNDYLDVLPHTDRTENKGSKVTTIPADPKEWFAWAAGGNYQGIDTMYGGLGQDAMQADVSPTGPAAGDRMIDWIGVYNIYYLCGPQYGEYVITRSPSPSVIEFLVQLAAGDGAADPGSAGSSGYAEISIVYKSDYQTNSHPPHPDTPGHFTCP